MRRMRADLKEDLYALENGLVRIGRQKVSNANPLRNVPPLGALHIRHLKSFK